ncbi:hypothetical protein QQG74_10890 [Micromonospora sp. FIMYZ51]|uniref:hypothetical protein n=1 Tax=Micromonospora sp. FIMYZ51 TaxID=3051832 RepID=UPI00311F27FF
MNERPYDGPLPPAYPVPGGRPRHPDGDRVPMPPHPGRAAFTRRRYAHGVGAALLVLLLILVGALR